ncbi:MAG TPA: hypothetical protein VK636_07455 [Gemmatimonadaceae bacterium]|nr:hypothetical protein [Gemmatimonadaceae bacterium]
MLSSLPTVFHGALAGGSVAGDLPVECRPVTATKPLLTERPEPQPRAPELAPVAARDVVRVAAVIAIVLTLWLSVIDVMEFAFEPANRGKLGFGVLALSIAVPLHIRHLIYGVRGERPPAGAWTLTALALVTLAGAFLTGDAWMRELTPLAVSILIVVPGWKGFLLTGVVVLVPVFFVGAEWHASAAHPLPGLYLASVIIWRTGTQFVPLRLLAALRALESASHELEARAVVQARVRIDTELRKGVGSALEQIIARGEAARAAAETDPTVAVIELQRLVSESRRALADARRVVAGYRESSVRAELDAVAVLLEASGARVRIIVADGLVLDSPNQRARDVIRAALAETLRAEPSAGYQIHVTRDNAGALAVRVASDNAAVNDVEDTR